MSQQLPNMLAALVAVKTGRGDLPGFLIPPWNSFFQRFVQQAPAVMNVELDGSPFEFIANEIGTLFITGGTVSAVNLIRGTTTINVGTLRAIPIGIGDAVRVTYSVLPTLQFLPQF